MAEFRRSRASSRSSAATRSRWSPCAGPRSETRSRSSCASELAEAFAGSRPTTTVGCVVLTGAGSAFCSGMDTTPVRRRPRQSRAAGRDEHGRLPGGRRLPASGRRRGQRARARRRLRALAALRPAGRRRVGAFRLPRAAAGHPAELRGRAGGAAGDGGQGALPDRPGRRRRRGPAARDRPRGGRRRRGRPRASRSPRRSPRCPARRSSRPSAGRCSSATTSGAFSSTRRSGSSAARCSAS